jgi:hypothetical protein
MIPPCCDKVWAYLSAAPLELLSWCDLSWLADAALCLGFLVLMVLSLIAICLVVYLGV